MPSDIHDHICDNQEFMMVDIGNNQQVKLILPHKPAPNTPPQEDTANQQQFSWDDAATKLFFEAYFNFKGKYGKKMIIQKRLYEAIASEMQKHGYAISAVQVCYKYKSLERAFKLHVTCNKTGRGRKILNYETEMTEIFGKKHKIVPKVVSGRHGLTIGNTSGVLPNVETHESESVDPRPSTSSAGLEEVYLPEGQSSASQKEPVAKNKVTKRDGKMAMALEAVKEEVARQSLLLEKKMEQDKAILEEIRSANEINAQSNTLKEEANAQRARRNELLSEQIVLLKELLNRE
ncbi:uncharacterized protein LOC124158063 [Ischnura elegans]|uniref:uncharacterized protein LOC124158063 n=1 Tax=Ischnura elegans TaxID=197161 RepID=UPI001ED8B204|nr:uncharacterized protein LOC124158063 [Ischnura elegans]